MMKLKHLSISICISFFVLSVSAVRGQKLHITGKVGGGDTTKIFVVYAGNVDSAVTIKGQFDFALQLKEPTKVRFVAARKGNLRKNALRTFFVHDGEVRLNAPDISGVSTAVIHISDTSYNKLYKDYTARFNPLVKVARTLIDRSYDTGRTEAEKKLFRELLDKVDHIEMEVMEQFALENTDNIVGAYVFAQMQQVKDAGRLEAIYQKFSPALRGSSYLKLMAEKIASLNRLVVGNVAPDFSAITANGDRFKLSDQVGKIVVLDFWGTWCQPCVAGIPKMKDYNSKYKNKVVFVSIACNDREQAWREAIESYQLDWVQLLNDPGKVDLSQQFNVLAFPTKIIIGPNGQLIGSYKGENEDFYRKLDGLVNAVHVQPAN